MKPIILVSEPTFREPKRVTKQDVWGPDPIFTKKGVIFPEGDGMIVAKSETICPIFKDKVPYKSVTVVCTREQEFDVCYWLEYVHGGNSIAKRKILPDNKVGIRSDYMCW
jgi:hypothetical protein